MFVFWNFVCYNQEKEKIMKEQKISQTEKVLNFISEFTKKNSYPPSVREMCAGLGISSTATIVYHLKKLEEQGKLSREKSRNRAIEVSGVSMLSGIPVVGKVAAGIPITATENVEDTLSFSQNLFGDQDELFILKVQGESMINAGIFDGDKIVVHKQENAENGEIVVAMIDGEATVKRFYKEKNQIRLQPENDFMSPIIVKDVQILGTVVGLIRNYK